TIHRAGIVAFVAVGLTIAYVLTAYFGDASGVDVINYVMASLSIFYGVMTVITLGGTAPTSTSLARAGTQQMGGTVGKVIAVLAVAVIWGMFIYEVLDA